MKGRCETEAGGLERRRRGLCEVKLYTSANWYGQFELPTTSYEHAHMYMRRGQIVCAALQREGCASWSAAVQAHALLHQAHRPVQGQANATKERADTYNSP
eukprot:g28448.t1